MSGVTVAKYIIEAALFSAGKSITVEELSEATGLDRRTVRKAAKELIEEYSGRDSSLVVTKTVTGFALEVRAKYARYTMKLAEQEIPRMALKTLAIIAFHQPIKQSKLKMMIGGRAYEDVKVLKEMGLITVRPDGRSYRLETSARFPDYFGIDPDPVEIKKHLADLVGVTLQEVPEGDDDEEDEEAAEGSEAPEGEDAPDGDVEAVEDTPTPEGEDSPGEDAPEEPLEETVAEEIVEDNEEPETDPVEIEESEEDPGESDGSGEEPSDEVPEPSEPEDTASEEPPAELDDDEDGKYGSDRMKEVQDALHDDGGM